MNKKQSLSLFLVCGLFLSAITWLTAHPHLNKTVTASLPSGAEVTVSYQTVPANEDRVAEAGAGEFLTPRGPKLELSQEITAGDVSIPAGEYTIGVIKNGEEEFTLALVPGELDRGAEPDMSEMIKLESQFNSSAGDSEHMSIDIAPGTGQLEGKVVLALHFGSLSLQGALS